MSASFLKMAGAKQAIKESDLPLLGRSHIRSLSHNIETIEIFDEGGLDKVQLGDVITIDARFMAELDGPDGNPEDDPTMKIMEWVAESVKGVAYRHILAVTLDTGDVVATCYDFPNAYILSYREVNDEVSEDGHRFVLKIAQKRVEGVANKPLYKRGDVYDGCQEADGEDKE